MVVGRQAFPLWARRNVTWLTHAHTQYKCSAYTLDKGTKGNGVGYPHSGTPSQSIPNILQPLYPKSWDETEQGLSHGRTPPSMHNDMIEPHHFPINMFEVHGFLWGRESDESDYNTSLYQHKPPISKQKSLAQSFQNVPDKQFTAESAIRSPDVFSQSLLVNLSLVDSIPPKVFFDYCTTCNLLSVGWSMLLPIPHGFCARIKVKDEKSIPPCFFGAWRSGDFVLLFGVQGVQPPKLPS